MVRILFLISCIVVVLFNSCQLNEDSIQLSHAEFRKSHLYNIGQSTFQFHDTLRKRPLKTEIWYPVNDTTGVNSSKNYPFILPPTSRDAKHINNTFPLVLMSHGTGGNRFSQMWLASELSSMGYIVAAVDHWGNTLDNKIPINFVKIWERPLDITFILDEILKDDFLSNKIDRSKIGMIGFSLGGFTSIALAGGTIDYQQLKEFSKTQEGKIEFTTPELGDVSKLLTPEIVEEGSNDFRNLKDSRISIFVAMAPALGQGFNAQHQFKNIENNLLIIGAQNDLRTPVQTNAKHYNKLIKQSTYKELEGNIGHYIFMNEAKRNLKKNAPLIFKDNENVDRLLIHKNVSKTILDFLRKEFDQ